MSHAFHHTSSTSTEDCVLQYSFTTWSDIFVVVVFAYGWNASVILWLVPWRRKFSYLGATLEPLFQSEEIGISLENWRQLGHARLDVDYIRQLANRKDYQFYVFILTLNIWILFFAKLAMWSSFGSTYYKRFSEEGFADFFTIEISLVTLLMISTEFFAFSVLPALQVGAQFSNIIKVLLYSVYFECVLTFILLCVQWPILIAVMYIGACIVLTGMILSMAVLCLLFGVILSGLLTYGLLSIMFYWLPYYYGSQWKVNIRTFSASITWLLITLLVWVIGVCLAFLFTQDQFDSELCLQITNTNEMVAAALVLVSAVITIFGLLFIWIAHFTQWDCSELLDFGAEHRALSHMGGSSNGSRGSRGSRNSRNAYQSVRQNDNENDRMNNDNEQDTQLAINESSSKPAVAGTHLTDQDLRDVVDAIPDSGDDGA